MIWHDEALAEYSRIPDRADRDAIDRATDKLEALGPLLTFPHASGIVGTHDVTVRALRPRRGRSRWRPLYCRVGDVFLILAIAREAGVDRREFAASVDRAERRRLDLPEFDR